MSNCASSVVVLLNCHAAVPVVMIVDGIHHVTSPRGI